MSLIEVRIPDLGEFNEVEVIEVHVAPGDVLTADAPLITLETDKASMDVPAPAAGKVESVAVEVGSKVATGDLIVTLAVEAATAEPDRTGSPQPERPQGRESPAATAAAAAGPAGASQPTERSPPVAATAGARSATSVPGPRLVVIGAGPGGYTAAFRAADLGLDVTLIERHRPLGGVCLNVGCIPSKALLHAARVIEDAREMSERGIAFGAPTIDAPKLVAWKNEVVGQLTRGLATLAKQRKVRVVRGTATFASPHALEVQAPDGTTEQVPFDQCIIAAGSEPARLPGAPDDSRVLDSTGALELTALPERLLVVGGGIIGLEMATVYDALGVRVSVVELTKTLIPGCDRDLVKPLEKRIRARYEAIMLGTRVERITASEAGLDVQFAGDEAPSGPERFGGVLVAVGRKPNGRTLGAERAGVEVDERGYVRVDKQQRTNVPHIFAIGDIVGMPMLAHKASHEGRVAAEVAAGERRYFDARVVPSVAYTDPEVAWVGLTEEEAKARGIDYSKGQFPWAASARSLTLGRGEGLTKLLFDPATHRLLGAGIVGTNAGDLIAEAALAIEMDCDAADIGLTIHPHPTLSETLAFAAEAAEGTITDLYVPRRR